MHLRSKARASFSIVSAAFGIIFITSALILHYFPLDYKVKTLRPHDFFGRFFSALLTPDNSSDTLNNVGREFSAGSLLIISGSALERIILVRYIF